MNRLNQARLNTTMVKSPHRHNEEVDFIIFKKMPFRSETYWFLENPLTYRWYSGFSAIGVLHDHKTSTWSWKFITKEIIFSVWSKIYGKINTRQTTAIRFSRYYWPSWFPYVFGNLESTYYSWKTHWLAFYSLPGQPQGKERPLNLVNSIFLIRVWPIPSRAPKRLTEIRICTVKALSNL